MSYVMSRALVKAFVAAAELGSTVIVWAPADATEAERRSISEFGAVVKAN